MGDPITAGIGIGLAGYNAYQSKRAGDRAKKAMSQQRGYANFAADVAKQQWEDLNPVRTSVIDRATRFMEGDLDPTASPMYAPIKGSTEQQYGNAKDAIMSSLPRGGTLQDSMAKLETAKANTLSGLIAKLVEDEYAKAFALGSGASGDVYSGMSTAIGSGPGMAQLGQTGNIAGAQTRQSLGDMLSMMKLMPDLGGAIGAGIGGIGPIF